jgi:hypothetical protein
LRHQPRHGLAILAGAAVLLAPGLAAPERASALCLPTPACLEATLPGNYSWGTLAAGPAGNQSAEQVITVSSNGSWGVRIGSDQTDGRMREWNGAAYVGGSALAQPLEWALTRTGTTTQPPAWAAISSSPATVASGQPSTCGLAVCSAKEVGVTYRQVVGFGDRPAGANDYRILVTFDASHGF